jgi:hypothetical protein
MIFFYLKKENTNSNKANPEKDAGCELGCDELGIFDSARLIVEAGFNSGLDLHS